MGQNQRRPGFRLRWGEGAQSDPSAAEHASDAGTTPEPAEQAGSTLAEGPAGSATAAAAGDVSLSPAAADATEAEPSPFLQDLVGAMRGVAESSRESSLDGLRNAVEERVQELTAGAGARAEELRRTAELDVNGIGDWERSEIERVRREAEQRRLARRAQLEQQLADHQSAADRDVQATQARLEQHERALAAFFTQLSEITDPAAFVAAAKRMPAPPDLASTPVSPGSAPAAINPADATSKPLPPTNGAQPDGSSADALPADETLAARLAQLDEKLGTSAATQGEAAPAAAPATAPAAASTALATASPPVTSSTDAEASTPIVVKGLGSFGAITSFKQALERVDGIRGVTLSLGPTGDFVYRASHAPDFDILGAIRSIEGPSAEIEQSEGSLRVTIERPR